MSYFAKSICPSPWGELTFIASDEGICRVLLPNDPRTDINSDTNETSTKAALFAGNIAKEMEMYLKGRTSAFSTPLDFRFAAGFYRTALFALCRVPYGHSVSYTELANMSGRPSAVRAAASACAKNPLPIIVPCHRVIPAAGGLGNYRGGPLMKQELLLLEKR